MLRTYIFVIIHIVFGILTNLTFISVLLYNIDDVCPFLFFAVVCDAGEVYDTVNTWKCVKCRPGKITISISCYLLKACETVNESSVFAQIVAILHSVM